MGDNVSEEDVDKFIMEHITQEKWDELGDTMKSRHRNMARNYLSFPEIRNFMPLPDFLRKPVQKAKKTGSKSVAKSSNSKDVEPAPSEETQVPVRRNPKRKVVDINYYEEEEPGEDRYVYCDTCEEEYLDFCSKCGMLKSLKDFPVPVGTEDRAKKTAPKGVLEIRPSSIHGFGVFAVRNVRKGIQMGPYEGQVTRVNTTNGYCWKLRDGRLIDAANETCSNWMRYVNCARHMEEQNVAAFQYKGQLYYRTCKEVQKGEELLVYYGQSFAKNLGIDTKKYFQPNQEEVITDYFSCQFCKIGLSTREYRDMHQRYCKFRPNRMVLCSKDDNFVCQYCKCTLTRGEFLKTHEVYCSRNPKRGEKSRASEKRFQCLYCDKKFSSKCDLNRHKNIHEKENAGVYTCGECPFKTIHFSNIQVHQRIHQSDFRFKCEGCHGGFNQKVHLDGHILSTHPHLEYLITSKLHYCLLCKYKTVGNGNLKRHLIHNHNNNAQKFYCDKCQYYSINKGSLKRHLLTHAMGKNKPYVCVKCRKSFNRKDQLDSHILYKHNEDEKLIKSITSKIRYCRFCNFKTIVPTHLKYHINSIHHKDQAEKFYCYNCSYFSVSKSNLKQHIMSVHLNKKRAKVQNPSKVADVMKPKKAV